MKSYNDTFNPNASKTKRLGKISVIQDDIARCQLKFKGKNIRIGKQKILTKILICFLTTNRPDGGKHKSKRDMIYENLKNLLSKVQKNG